LYNGQGQVQLKSQKLRQRLWRESHDAGASQKKVFGIQVTQGRIKIAYNKPMK
jgi:hypothetical protein